MKILERDAERILDWIKNRGGVAVWDSCAIGDPGQAFTPALDKDGNRTTRPGWRYGGKPSSIVTDASDVTVLRCEKFKSFHVSTKKGGGFSIVLTDASSRKLKKELERAGEGSWHEFDYGSHDNCIVYRVDSNIPLPEWSKCEQQQQKRNDMVCR